MKRYDETKVGKIENKYGNVFIFGLSYLLDKGREFCQQITEAKIVEDVKGNAMMSDAFVKQLVRCAKELSTFNSMDILAYVKEYISINGCTDWKEIAEEYRIIASNAISLGQLDERFEKENLLNELGCDEDAFNDITDGLNAYSQLEE